MLASPVFLALALALALVVIVVAAGFFVRGAVAIAHRFGLPEFLVGSVIVAVGTSAPEVAINVSAVLEDAGDIVVSNIIGSNIVNVALGIGIAALMISFDRARKEYSRTLIIGLLGTIAVLAVTLITADGAGMSLFGRGFAIALFAAFLMFMYHSIMHSDADEEDEEVPADLGLAAAVACVVLGAGAMAFMSDLAVETAVSLSGLLAIPEAVIGATIIAAGGSLPEISSCIAAARIGRPNLVLGNIVGSQIFNILGILGLSGMITSFGYSTFLAKDLAILIAITLLVMACLFVTPLRRYMGYLLVGCYGVYVIYLFCLAA